MEELQKCAPSVGPAQDVDDLIFAGELFLVSDR